MPMSLADTRYHFDRAIGLIRRSLASLRTRGWRATLHRVGVHLRRQPAPRREPLFIPANAPFAPFAVPASEQPLASIIIPVFNHCRHTLACLRALAAHPPAAACEILVIDDHSTDDTMEKMGRYGENDRVRYIRNETNKGASASRNRGVQLAKGDYIAFLDADDYWDPEKLEKQEKALAKTGDVLCCTGRELIYDQEPEKQKIFSVPERITYKMLLRGNVIGCSSVLAKRSVLLEFPMEKDECHEDYLDWLRILKKYGTACGVDEPLLKYRLSSTGKSGSKLHSAGMTYRVYRELGMGTFRSLYCFACYAVNGVRKYYGKGKKRGRD